MPRAALETMSAALEAAYRGDRFHALLRNLEDVRDDEWERRPANHSTEVFGTKPELSIADLVAHVGGAKLMWTNHSFGDTTLTWPDAAPPARDRASMLAWLEDAHAGFAAAVAALEDDAELRAERMAHWGRPLPTSQIISIVINHDLYHSGEINRQRTLIRGADGWEPAS